MISTIPAPSARQAIFVVHGRNLSVRDAMFDLISAFGLEPLEWSKAVALTGEPNPFIGQVLDGAFRYARAVLVLFTPDDLAHLDPDLWDVDDPAFEKSPSGQARPNVLFEAGMAIGRRPQQTILVEIGPLRPFSDIAGRHILRFNGTIANRLDLARRLEAAGCDVDIAGNRWQTAGTFLVSRPEQQPAVSDDFAKVPPIALDLTIEASSVTGRGSMMILNQDDTATGNIVVRVADEEPVLTIQEEATDYIVPGQMLRFPLIVLDVARTNVVVTIGANRPTGERQEWTTQVPVMLLEDL